jgi:glycosyltransferase involved in cell wall biosynthesis
MVLALHRSPTAIALVVLVVGTSVALWMAVRAFRPIRVVDLSGHEIVDAPSSEIMLSVVTPSFNGASHINQNIGRLREVLDTAGLSHEIILVSDGSTDGTAVVVRANGQVSVRVIHYEQNKGKGFALRTGLSHARGTYVAFIDSDGDLDPRELSRFIQWMQTYDAHMVIGSKRHALSDVSYPWQRRIMSWTYHRLVHALFGIKVSDTQTGIKLVRRDVLAAVLPRMVEKRYAFDLELLVAARRLGFRRIMEAPVTLDYQFTSTISARAVKGILQDTAAIWYRRYLLHWYDRSLEPGEVVVAQAAPVAVGD